MNNILSSIISGTVLVVITALINMIIIKIKDKYHQPKWKVYFDKRLDEQEMHNLKTEITLFHADRKEDLRMNETERKWLCEAYSRYKALGGNSFVDTIYEEMKGWKTV